MFNKQIPINQNFLILILVIFSLAVNQFYGNRGAFPIESFAFFDTAYRILQGETPFKDYWAVSGVFLDYTQYVFFKIFGIHFQVYVFHASLVNCILTLMTYFFARNLNIDILNSFIYALVFSLLAYTTSGTLYVDNHASLICLAAIYVFIFGINNKQRKYFFLIPFLVGFAFFTKPAPTVYIFVLLSIILLIYIFLQKKIAFLLTLLFSSILFLFLTFLFFFFQDVSLKLILDQYFYFPVTIADQRYKDFTLSFDNIFFNFKFIYFFLIPLAFLNIKKIFSHNNYFFQNDFYIFLSILGLSICLMFHQLNTKNQLFILFLIPVICITLHSQLLKFDFKKKNILIIFLVIASILFTYKYHIRYNENRKFHEMEGVNFNSAVNAKLIDKKLSGLKWITPSYKVSPNSEVKLIKETLKILKLDESKKMLITNYSFFSVVLGESSNSPSRWFISNGGAYPVRGNEYFKIYESYINNMIKEKKIESVFVIYPVKDEELLRYVNIKCFEKKILNKITSVYKVIPECLL